MGRCKLECPDDETEYCICCTKQDSCQSRCDDMDSYEYAEECENYIKEDEYDYILIRIHPWSHIRSGRSCMCGNHVR